jgi:hypothetical protein
LFKSNIWTQWVSVPFGIGDFYVLEKSFRNQEILQWVRYSILSYGYVTSGCEKVDFEIWTAILGLDSKLDIVLKNAIDFQQKNKFLMLQDKNGKEVSSTFLNDFYTTQRASQVARK